MLFSRLLDRATLRWPSLCAVCGGWGHGRVCETCLEAHAAPVMRCIRCAIDLPAGARLCGRCLVAPPPYSRAVAAWDYAYPWNQLVARFKFHGALDLAGVFAQQMRVAAMEAAVTVPALFVAMPLAAGRLRERGYNQAWELARRLGRAYGRPARGRLLRRVRETPPQLTLPPERRLANVRGAFAVDLAQRGPLRGRSVALVDDVLTTGASAGEAARMLLEAGAADVSVWVVARTPRPRDA